MKRIFSVMILTFMTVSFLLPIFGIKSCAMEQEEPIVEETKEISARELSLIYMNKELEYIEELKETDKMEWYKQYRAIMCRYKHVIDLPLSVFDVYSEEEVRLICKTVETECHGQSFESKCHVASVIINRIESGRYGTTVEEVVTKPNQFAYFRETIPEDTLYAVMYSFEIQDLTNGAMAFHSNEKTETFGGMKYIFTDDALHHFYK